MYSPCTHPAQNCNFFFWDNCWVIVSQLLCRQHLRVARARAMINPFKGRPCCNPRCAKTFKSKKTCFVFSSQCRRRPTPHIITHTISIYVIIVQYPSFQVPIHVIALIFIIICPVAIEEQYQLGLIQSTEPLLFINDVTHLLCTRRVQYQK